MKAIIYSKKKLIILFIVSLLTLIFFAGFTILVRTKLLNQFDFDTTVRIQNHISKRWDTFFSFLSLLGSFEVMMSLLIIFLFVLKKIKGILVLCIFLSGHVIELIGKSFLHHSGPPFLFYRYNLGFLFPSSYVQPGSSYPSGHSFRIVFMSVMIGYFIFQIKRLSKTYKYILFAGIVSLCSFVLVSRVSLGEHWTTDVIGGAILGAGFGILSLQFML